MWKDHTRSSKGRLGKWVSIDRDEARCVIVWEYSWFLHETVNNCLVLVPYETWKYSLKWDYDWSSVPC